MRAESFKDADLIRPSRELAPYHAEMKLYHAAAGELIRLAFAAPDGLTRLKRFQEEHRARGFIDWEEQIDGGRLEVVAIPSAAMINLIIELRGSSEGKKGSSV